MSLLAAGSAALATGVLPAAAQVKRPAGAPASRPRLSAAAQEDLRKQKQYTRAALEKIRAFPLPYGSDPAFVFRPVRSPRGRR